MCLHVALDVTGAPADARTVNWLARLQWIARQRRGELRLTNVPPHLRDLIEFVGLAGVLLQ